jgi:phosphoenolpyruvate carboxykinase (GTP)
MPDTKKLLKERLTAEHYNRLVALANPKVNEFVADAIELCRPASVFVCTDKPEDLEDTRRRAVETGEERPLKMHGHTIHFDGMDDQGRDREVTK